MASSTVLSRSVLPLNCLTSTHKYARRSSTLRYSQVSPQAFLRRSCGDCQVLAQRSGQGRQTNHSNVHLAGKLHKVLLLQCVGGSRRGQNVAVHASGEPVTTEIPSEASPAASFKHILLPIIDSNPYLSSGTRAAASTATSLARAFGSDITVAVVDEGVFTGDKELRTKNIRWHLAEGGFENFALIEKEGQNPGAVIGEIADDMNLDLVILGMESIHSKQIDGNTLAEFVPCPVLLLP